ncbi:DUF6193 family natural product biosynthesis protein [Streptomyces sp. NBC_00322]|uniref:DUF6193 family natural product biosynthesis protein n=1 Tax=Streptomyces sp. NBC_00322 TaxID=2975712 RepID=UPI002E27FD98|nr:DUF6193 family natural product biosynthesis protein [Streptomyces sp. NBC_00322]
MTYSYDPVMYPELAGGASLGAALGAAGAGAGPEFADQDSSAGPVRAVAVRGDRKVAVGVAVRERGFGLTFTRAGTTYARARTPDLAGAALAAEGWLAGLGPRELAARWPFVAVDELLLAYEEGNEVEVAWRLVRQEASENWSEVVEAAYARPELAAMFPIFSHGMFRMLRSSRFTSYDVPFLCRGSEGFVLQYTGPVLAEGDADQMVDAYLRWLADHPA